MKKIALFLAITVIGVFLACSAPTQHEDGTLWGTGVYSGIIAAPITYLTIDFTRGRVELGKDENGKAALSGLMLESKSTIDTLWASVKDSEGYSYNIRLAIDYKNNHGVRGRWVLFDQDYIKYYGPPEFALIKIE